MAASIIQLDPRELDGPETLSVHPRELDPAPAQPRPKLEPSPFPGTDAEGNINTAGYDRNSGLPIRYSGQVGLPRQRVINIAPTAEAMAARPQEIQQKPASITDVGIGFRRGLADAARMVYNPAVASSTAAPNQRELAHEAASMIEPSPEEMEGRTSFGSKVLQGVGRAPVDVAKYAAATAAAGGNPILGMGAADMLTNADTTPAEAIESGAKGAALGAALGPLSKLGRAARIPAAAAIGAGATAAEGGDTSDIAASALLMGGMAGLHGRSKVELVRPEHLDAAPITTEENFSRLPEMTGDRYLRAVGKNAPPPAEESARVFEEAGPTNAERYAELFDAADKLAARRQRTKPSIPETGVPENVARTVDARENLARQLTGKLWSDLNNPDRIAIDDLIRQGYSGAPTPPVLSPSRSMPPPQPQQRETMPAPMAQGAQSRMTPAVSPAPMPPPAVVTARNWTGTPKDAKLASDGPAGTTSGESAPPSGSRQPGNPVGYGAGTLVRIPGETGGFEARYSIRELDDVYPSHNPRTLAPNPDYQLRNDRDYSEPRNSERILKQVAEFDPAYLVADSPDATNGAPVIDRNGNVLGGNSRTITLARAYGDRPDAAQAYRAALADKAAQLGIDPNQVARMRRPVLVREVTRELSPQETQSAITDLNKTGTAALTPAERALADSRRVSANTLDFIGQKIDEQGPDGTLAQALKGDNGRQVVQTLVNEGVISIAEKPQYLNERGLLTKEGKNRISRLLLGRLFSDATQFDQTPPELRNKLERVTAPLARLAPGSEWDITPHVREALDLLDDARQHNIRNLDDLRAQQGMFGDARYSPQAFAVAKALQQAPLRVAQAFRQYASDANYAAGGNLLGNAPRQPEAFGAAFPDSAGARGIMPPPTPQGRSVMPPPGAPTNEGERGAIAANLLTAPARAVGLDKFIQQDVIPGASGVVQKTLGAMDDIKKLLAPQTRGPLAQNAAGLIRERGANLAQARDRAVNALRGAKAYFDGKDPNYNLQFIDAVENGDTNRLPPKEQQFAVTMRQLIDQRSESLKQLGLLRTFYENYFPHLWKDPNAAANWLQNWFSKRPMAGSEAYRKQRTYPTMLDGINDPEFHMEPAFTNPVDFVTAKLGEMDKSITAHQIIEELKSAGDLQPLANGERPPVGTARIDDRIASGYVAPESLATVINNHLSPGMSQSPLYQVWRGLNNTMNMIDLSLSYYHGLTTTLNSSLSDMALGLKQAAAGKPLQAGASVARGFVPFASVVQDVMKGTKLLKVWDGAPAPDAMTGALVDAIRAGGGRARQDSFYSQNYAKGFMQALRSYNLPGAAVRLPFAALEKAMAPLMEYMVPRVKMGAFAKRAQMEIEANPNMDPAQARETFGKIWDSTDNRFGQFVYSNLFMNKIAKDLMMAVVGRPGWNIGTVREIGGGMADLAKAAFAPIRGQKPELTDRAAFTTALFLGGAAINGLVNFALTGTPPEGDDYLAPRDGGLNEDGRPSRIVLPTYLSKDLYSYATRPLATLKAKAAPALTVASDLLTNRDFQNRKIYGDGGTGLGEYARNTITPYSVQGIQKNMERGASPARTVLPLIGVMPAGKQVGKSKAEHLMAEYQQEAMPNTRAPQSERNQLKNRITILVRTGKQDTALQTAAQAYSAGKLTDDDINHAIDRAQFSPLVADFKRLNLDQALDVMQVATPAERKQLLPELGGRLDRTFDRLPPEDQARIEGRIQKLNLAAK